MMGAMVSPLRGADGNVEFLVHLAVPSAEAGLSDPQGPAVGRRRPAARLDVAALAASAADSDAGDGA
jgi:hypothetical protein